MNKKTKEIIIKSKDEIVDETKEALHWTIWDRLENLSNEEKEYIRILKDGLIDCLDKIDNNIVTIDNLLEVENDYKNTLDEKIELESKLFILEEQINKQHNEILHLKREIEELKKARESEY